MQNQDGEAIVVEPPPSHLMIYGRYYFFATVLVFFVIASIFVNNSDVEVDPSADIHGMKKKCPGSPSLVHSECSLLFEISDFMCRDVKEEIERRMLGKKWLDSRSSTLRYELLEERDEPKNIFTLGLRIDKHQYVDKVLLTYTDVQGEGCFVGGCSESQNTSFYDSSTNFCNLYNLVCGTNEGCQVSRHNMKSTKYSFNWCPYHDVKACFE